MAEADIIRLAFFAGILAVVAVWERIAPRRSLTDSKGRRWVTNLSLAGINTATTRFILPVLPVGMAAVSWEQGWGILSTPHLPFWGKVLLAVVALDFVIYLQHALFHHVPILWRFHRMHHTDLDVDVTTGNRFHPLEIVVSACIKVAAVALTGAPALAVVVFEVVLNATSQFNHGNIRIPVSVDRYLRLFVVTPDMHRVHHSVIPCETNSNFGFNLPWWDRLCGTYRPQPEKGHSGMSIGLDEFRDPTMLTLLHLLVQPFTRNKQ